jgi:hypothetical protein
LTTHAVQRIAAAAKMMLSLKSALLLRASDTIFFENQRRLKSLELSEQNEKSKSSEKTGGLRQHQNGN